MTLKFCQILGPKGFCLWRQSFAYKNFCQALFAWPLSEKFYYILYFGMENVPLRPKKVATELKTSSSTKKKKEWFKFPVCIFRIALEATRNYLWLQFEIFWRMNVNYWPSNIWYDVIILNVLLFQLYILELMDLCRLRELFCLRLIHCTKKTVQHKVDNYSRVITRVATGNENFFEL